MFAVCNLIEGLINHHLLQSHQLLKRFLQNWKWWDFGFFAIGDHDARVRVLAWYGPRARKELKGILNADLNQLCPWLRGRQISRVVNACIRVEWEGARKSAFLCFTCRWLQRRFLPSDPSTR
ncbi:DUF2243 domain-containing protein [Tabrizicola sp. WMC-M-20]|nr:DUF2243 domain-containing protein [Tabrizicola sp. WMC-M-20]